MNEENKDPIDALEERIDSFKKKQSDKEKVHEPTEESENMRMGLRAGAELVGAIAVSSGIGWYLDKTFDTKPLFLLVMLILGVITGFVNVWRTSEGISTAVGLGFQTKLHNDDEEQAIDASDVKEEETKKDG